LVLPTVKRFVNLAQLALFLLVVLLLFFCFKFLGVLRDLLGKKYLDGSGERSFSEEPTVILRVRFERDIDRLVFIGGVN